MLAYLRLVRVVAFLSASHSALIPSAVYVPLPYSLTPQIRLPARLSKAVRTRCQRLLTDDGTWFRAKVR